MSSTRNIYIAAKFSSGVRLRAERDRIHAADAGRVISTWIDQQDKTEQDSYEMAAHEALTEALRDIAEVRSADLVLFDTEGSVRRGGRETELGIALGAGVPVWTVGPRWKQGENIFNSVPPHFDTWDEVIAELERDVESVREYAGEAA